jgi:hypothetical protein
VPREQLVEIDMLPKIKNKCFLTPELAPTFASNDDLDQSPCRHIIDKKGQFYTCRLHPKEANSIYLDAIEQHCKYKDPEVHKAEILRLLELTEKEEG